MLLASARFSKIRKIAGLKKTPNFNREFSANILLRAFARTPHWIHPLRRDLLASLPHAVARNRLAEPSLHLWPKLTVLVQRVVRPLILDIQHAPPHGLVGNRLGRWRGHRRGLR